MKLFPGTKHLSAQQQQIVQAGLACGLTRRQVRIYMNSALSPAQMEELRLAFLDGLSIREVKAMAHPGIDPDDLRRMRNIYALATEIQMDMKQLKSDI